VVVSPDELTVRGGGSGFGYTLGEASQGSVAVRLSLGASFGWCTVSAARSAGSPPTTAKSDHPGRFVGTPDGAAPAACPSPVGAASPSGAFLDLDAD
jgi:hypothetical protein